MVISLCLYAILFLIDTAIYFHADEVCIKSLNLGLNFKIIMSVVQT